MNVTGEKISSGFLSDYEPLGVNGDPVYRAATQIRTLLIKYLGENVANLFATPLRDDRNNAIDWYSAENGQARSFKSLSQTEQEKYSKEIKEKLASVEELGLKLSTNPQNQTAITYSGLIKSIQNYPNSSQIFIVNERPIIAFWGFKSRQAVDIPKTSKIITSIHSSSILKSDPPPNTSSLDGALTSSSKTNSSPTGEASSLNNQIPLSENIVSPSTSFWSRYGWWLLIVFLIFLGTPTFMRGCSTDFPLLNNERQTPNFPPNPVFNSTEPISNPVPKLTEPISNPVPKLTEPISNPVPKSTEPIPNPVSNSPEPIFTKKALTEKDLSIFKGNWNLITELFNANTKEVIKLKMTFDESGQGNATIEEKNGQTCSGSASAKIDSESSFSISSTELKCEVKGSYVPNYAVCTVRVDLTTADCMLKCANGQCSAVFERQK